MESHRSRDDDDSSKIGAGEVLGRLVACLNLESRHNVQIAREDGCVPFMMFSVLQGQPGMLIDKAADARVGNSLIRHVRRKASAENIIDILKQHSVSKVFGLLNVQDTFHGFHLLRSILCEYSPRVIAVKYNASLGEHDDCVVPYLRGAEWNGSAYFGASFRAYCALACRFDYKVVCCDEQGSNVFLVRKDCWNDEEPHSSTMFRPGREYAADPHHRRYLTSEHYLMEGVDVFESPYGHISYFANDEFVGGYLAKGRYWDASLVEYLGKLLGNETGLALDIGAHIGSHALALAHHAPGLKLHCFEPQVALFRLLERNIHENGLESRIQATCSAVAHRSGDATLSRKATDGSAAGQQFSYGDGAPVNLGGIQLGTGGQKCRLLCIDDLQLSSIRYVKIDVEGAEPLVVTGMAKTLEANTPIFVFEERQDRRLPPEILADLKVNVSQLFSVTSFLRAHGYRVQPLGLDRLATPIANNDAASTRPALNILGKKNHSAATLSQSLLKTLRRGLAHQQAGRLDAAEKCCVSVLADAPQCAHALQLMGLVAHQTGRYNYEIELLSEANVMAPDDPEVLNNFGATFVACGDFQQALLCYERIVELEPNSPAALTQLASVLEVIERFREAIATYRRAIELKPRDPELYRRLGRTLRKAGDFQKALEPLEEAQALAPENCETHNELGLVLIELGQFVSAIQNFQRALSIDPNSAQTFCNLGHFFMRKKDVHSAVESYRYAAKLAPKSTLAYTQLGIALFELGEFAEALDCFHRVREISPKSEEVRFHMSLIRLVQGDLTRGWEQYESRWSSVGRHDRREFYQPQWKGEPLDGARILLHAEQGLGDTMQFVRYVSLVAALGGQVLLEVQPRLRSLLSGIEGAVQVFSRGEPVPEFSWHCPLLSLPLAFGTELETIPANIPYIRADRVEASKWQQRIQQTSLKVGLCWSGNTDHNRNIWRSIPLELLSRLTEIENTQFYSLQMGAGAEQLSHLRHPRIVDLASEQRSFADTAAIVDNLDLVITIDTSIAHLAGAMGKPVWVLLHNAPDWRWFLQREDSPWYPTARLFRQSAQGDWQNVVTRVEDELRQLQRLAEESTGSIGN
jgi:FkbM family methyltransferase